MTRVEMEEQAVLVPDWVSELESFRRWCDDDEFPEHGRIAFLKGEVWIDLSKEQMFTHDEPKCEINTVLRTRVKARRMGRYFTDGAFLSSEEGNVSNKPDGLFVSAEALREERVRVVEGRHEGHVEWEGGADMVLEAVSRSSVKQDTEMVREAYALAGVRENWLVDCRNVPLRFDILRLVRGRYVAARRLLASQPQPNWPEGSGGIGGGVLALVLCRKPLSDLYPLE